MTILMLLCLLGAGSVAPATGDRPAAEAPGATVLLIRHAEKLDSGADPGLSSRGRERAANLATMLADAGVRRVLSTDYRRTRETVEPLATALDLRVETYDPRELEALAARLLAVEGPSVVVGHSNTTPALVALLGGEPGSPIDDASEFDRLYVLHRTASGNVSTLLLRYGVR